MSEVIVNAHHYAEMIVDYLKANGNFGMRIEVSREEELLDTGGGLKKAAHFFLDASGPAKSRSSCTTSTCISTIDLGRMVQFHTEHDALATLAVQDRETSRYLLFDEHGVLCGRQAASAAKAEDAKAELARPAVGIQALAFSGIHVISPLLLTKMEEEGAFSIVATYLRLAAQGENIVAFRADDCYWRDLGRPESIVQAAEDVAGGKYSIT